MSFCRLSDEDLDLGVRGDDDVFLPPAVDGVEGMDKLVDERATTRPHTDATSLLRSAEPPSGLDLVS